MRQTGDGGRDGAPGRGDTGVSDVATLAAIDVGTVSTRLIVARVGAAGEVEPVERRATITNLGRGVDASGVLDPAGIADTLACVRAYGARLAELAGRGAAARAVCVTLTSAARDAANSEELLRPMRDLGLKPQVIAGDVEARLSLLGVAGDFPAGMRVLVADVGGGSTELALGRRDPATGELAVLAGRSFDVGCRRVTERFLSGVDPSDPDFAGRVGRARAFVRDALGGFFAPGGPCDPVALGGACGGEAAGGEALPADELVCVGGTATSLVAVENRLVPYDPAFVHLRRMGRAEVGRLARELLAMDPERRRRLPGLQPRRADVIAAGALIVDELLAVSGFGSYVASESDSLFGLLRCERAALGGGRGPLGASWQALAADAGAFARACSEPS